MATRGRKPGFFVYAVMDGATPLYVGKGCGRRHLISAKKHGGTAKIIERFDCEDAAFARERHWIAELMPQNNISPGGNGGRSRPASKWDVPKQYKGRLSKTEWRAAVRSFQKLQAEIDEVGSRKYVARFILSKIDERNCAEWGVSKVDLSRLREVANGCGA